MSSSDESGDDIFAHRQVQRTVVRMEDVSSEDDCDMHIFLKSGKEKKEAMRERDRLQNLKAQVEGSKPSDGTQADADAGADVDAGADAGEVADASSHGGGGAAVEVVDVAADESAAAPPSARTRRGGKARASPRGGSGGRSPSPGAEDARARRALEEQRVMQERVARVKRAFQQGSDDEDNEEPPPSRRSRGGRDAGGAGGGGGSSSTAPAARARGRTVLLEVHSEGCAKLIVSHADDQPLNATDLIARIARHHGLEASRTRLRHAVGEPPDAAGDPIDLACTPLALGLDASAASVRLCLWAEEAAEALMHLKLSGSAKAQARLAIAPTATFASLIAAYCAAHLPGVSAERVSLRFDGDSVEAHQTPADLDMEDDDQLEVVVAPP